MYLGVDIGGTKTLVGVLDDNGTISEETQFATPHRYEEFLIELQKTASGLKHKEFIAGCVAIPGRVNRDEGIGESFGHLPWRNVPIQADLEQLFACPFLAEHDAALGGLSESMLLPKNSRILYITISTGIGTGFIENQRIVPGLANSEGGQMILEYHGKRMAWEDFASGKSIVKRFGKKASDIDDAAIWRRIAHDLAKGFLELMAITQPDIIVIGGSVGRYFDRFNESLETELERYKNPLVPVPKIQAAARPERAVLYGCYDLAIQHYGRPH